MKKSNLVGTVGVVLLSMSHTAHAIDECNDATGLPVPVTNTCTVDGNGPGNTCSGDVNGVIHNIIIGSIGDDVIKAKTGNDIVVGLAGFDIICLDQGNDFADAGSGDYVVRAGDGNDLAPRRPLWPSGRLQSPGTASPWPGCASRSTVWRVLARCRWPGAAAAGAGGIVEQRRHA